MIILTGIIIYQKKEKLYFKKVDKVFASKIEMDFFVKRVEKFAKRKIKGNFELFINFKTKTN